MNDSRRAAIYTLGCRTNQYESDAIARALRECGFEICDFSEKCDVYIVNTCSVTAEADRKSRQIIRRCRNQNEDAAVICLGCFSQLNPEKAKELGADCVLGNRNKLDAVEFAKNFVGGKVESVIGVPSPDDCPYEEMNASSCGQSRVFLKVEDGCDNHCSYCIIRKARGGVVSRPPENIRREAREMVLCGAREIILTGTEIASYGRDGGGYSLFDAISAASESGVERLRIGSVEPSVLTEELIGKLSTLGNFLPSFHLSLQSGSDKVLAEMRRKYNSKMVRLAVRRIRETYPDAEFSGDVIVGFPGETEEDFLDTCRLCEEVRFYHLHIFPYSDRSGTEATSRRDKIPAEVKNERFERLSLVAEESSRRVYEKYLEEKTELAVLFEERVGDCFFGHAQNMLDVKVETNEDISGKIYSCIAEKYQGECLICRIVGEIV